MKFFKTRNFSTLIFATITCFTNKQRSTNALQIAGIETICEDTLGFNPCLNGGECIWPSSEILGGNPNCYCQENFTGLTCEIDASIPNNPICGVDKPRTPDCKCPEGFFGIMCEIFSTTCSDIDWYKEGIRFDNDIPSAQKAAYLNEMDLPCQNGGRCIPDSSMLADFAKIRGHLVSYCECPLGYSGDMCEIGESSSVDEVSTDSSDSSTVILNDAIASNISDDESTSGSFPLRSGNAIVLMVGSIFINLF